MEFIYCPKCGMKLTKKLIGDEGLLPYCLECSIPYFDLFYTCIVVVVINNKNQILLENPADNPKRFTGVSGYVKINELLNDAVIREIKEELDLNTKSIKYLSSTIMDEKLLFGYLAIVDDSKIKCSAEVKMANWFSFKEAIELVPQNGFIIQLLKNNRNLIETI